MTKDRDELYGLHLRGTDRPMPFVNPYRKTGELNEIELFKLERHPLEIADAIIDTYSKEGPAGIAKVPGEVERLKWAGIYPQKQGGDDFMMRVKVPGGFLTAPQAREIGVAADAFGEGPDGTESRMFGSRYADLTTRQTVQIHWLRIEDIPRIWRRFAAVGLTTVQACGDSARNVLCCPVSGVDAARGLRRAAHRPGRLRLLHREPRVRQPAPQVQDVGLRLRRGLRPGGDQRHRPLAGPGRRRLARVQPAGRRRPVRRRADGLGHRRLRRPGPGRRGHPGHRPALRRAGQPREPGPGPDALPGPGARARGLPRRAGQAGPLRAGPRGRGPDPPLPGRPRGRPPPEGGRLLLRGLLRAGRAGCTGSSWSRRPAWPTPTATAPSGSAPTRTSPSPGSPGPGRRPARRGPAGRSTRPTPGPFSRGVVACTGSEFCRYAIVETKERAVKWARFLDEQLAGEPVGAAPTPGRFSGPRRGRRGDPHALLGLLGQLRPAPDRRHRLPRRGRPRGQPPGRGRRHRHGRLARCRRRVHRLDRARPPGQRRARRPAPGGAPLPVRAPPGRAVLQLGPPGARTTTCGPPWPPRARARRSPSGPSREAGA